MADLVDQYFSGSTPDAPKEDVVDRYFSGQVPDSGKTIPDLLSQARARAQQISPGLYSQGANDMGNLARAQQAHPVLGAITNAADIFNRNELSHFTGSAKLVERGIGEAASAAGWQGGADFAKGLDQSTGEYQPVQGSNPNIGAIGNALGTASGIAGNVVGGLPAMIGLGRLQEGVNTAVNSYDNATQQGKTGWDKLAQVAGDTAITTATNRIFAGQNGAIQGAEKSLQGLVAPQLQRFLGEGVSNAVARYGAKGTAGLVANEAATVGHNAFSNQALGQGTTDPSQLVGAALPMTMEGVHDLTGTRQVQQRMQAANGEPSAHPPVIPPAAPAIDPMAEFAKQLGVDPNHVSLTDVEGKDAPVPTGAAAETDAELKARQQAKEIEPPSPDTRAPVGPEAEADPDTLDRIAKGMAQPDEAPQRRASDRSTPATDRALIQTALQDPTAFGRRAEDWNQLSDENKTLLQKLREQQLTAPKIEDQLATSPEEKAQLRAARYEQENPQFQPVPASEGKTAPGEIGTGARPESKSNMLQALKEKQESAPGETSAKTPQNTEGVAGRINPLNKTGAVSLEPLHTYTESTLRPAISKAVNTFTDAWSSANNSLGTGEGLSPKQSETKLNVLQNQGELDRHAAVVEQAMKPLRETFKRDNITTSNDAGKQWIDAAEATGRSSHADPEAQAALDMNNKFNEANIQRAKKLGMLDDIVNPHDPDAPPTTKWSGDWIGRLYEKDDSNPFWSAPGGGKKSLQGSQAFLRGRDYDTYSQSLEAAQAKGLKPRYDNPADMMLAKQVEVARSLSTRELLRGEEDRTPMKWGEDGKPTPGDGLVALKDKSGADQRDIAIRKQDYAKYAGKMNGPEGQRFIKELRANDEAKIVRPGDPVPDGFVKSGVKATGKLFADPLTAHMFDSMIDTAPPGSAVMAASNLAKTIAGIQYMMGTVHLGLIATGHNALLLGKAADNAVHGELGLAAKNIGRAIDPSFQFGRKVRAQLLNPEGAGPEDVAGRVAASNANVYPKSVLATHNSWENAKTTWEKDPIRGMQQGVFALAGHIHDVMSNQVKLAKTQYQGALAETQAARGISQKEGRLTQAQGRAVGDAALGFASSKPAFQNQTYRAVRDLLFSAGQYMEGPIRLVAGGTTDALRNLAHVATGNFSKTEFTPRMQAILGGAISLAATNAMIQLASTTMTTGKPIMPTGQDWLHARTGKKDANGNDERVTPPGLATNVLEFLSHPTTYAFNRLNPVIRGATETVQNKDYRGKQVYGPSENPLIKGAEHVASETAPRAIGGGSGSNAIERGVSRYLGARFSNPSNSDAENFLRGVEQERKPGVSQESAAKSEAIGELSKAWKTNPSTFEPKWRAAKQKLDLTLADRAAVIKRANEPQGLIGVVKNSELDPKTLMQGWDKMTDDERKSVYYTMRERVGSANIGQDLKQQYWAQLSKDREAIK